MKNRFKIISIASVFIFSAVAFSGCGHWYKHKSPEKKAEWIVNEIQDELELNDAQLVKLNHLKDTILTIRKEFKESHKQRHDEFTALLDQATLDQSKLQTMVDTKLEFVGSKSPQVITAAAGFYDSLTAEQQQEIREKWQKRSERHRHYGWH